MKSRPVDDAAAWTGRAWQQHRQFWEQRFAAVEEPFALPAPGGSARVELDGAAGENLARISGASELGRMAVLLAALARVFGSLTEARTFAIDTPPLAGGGADEPVPLILEIPAGGETVGDLLGQVSELVSRSYTFQAFPARRLLANAAATNVLLICAAVHRDCVAREAYDVILELGEALTISGAASMAGPIGEVLAAFDDMTRRLDAIDVASAPERAELTAPPPPAPPRPPLFALFEEAARRHAGRLAVESRSRSLTYSKLLREATSLAHGLRAHDIGRGDVVAVPATRDVDWIVALLATLGAGAAYLPIDRTLPAERIRAFLDETHASALAECGGQALLPVPLPVVSSSDLAYILYTSGSTGTPKGVMVEHGGFANMILDQIGVFGIEASDRVLQLAAASFDASLSEIFMALLSGAALVLIDEETITDPRAFTRYVEERGVTAMTVTPLYLAALERHPLPSVRTLITAGDAAHVETTLHYARSKRVFNAYGPTEVSVCATMQRVDPTQPSIPIGTPVANSAVYVVDRYGRLLPRALSL